MLPTNLGYRSHPQHDTAGPENHETQDPMNPTLYKIQEEPEKPLHGPTISLETLQGTRKLSLRLRRDLHGAACDAFRETPGPGASVLLSCLRFGVLGFMTFKGLNHYPYYFGGSLL